ncbi:MAG: PorP/SprF family type IX secretion system membrane protein [Brumimicrobium sp.]|nr:PorP/SprF family type IX secretion system membrane protein [Brumimicrobium sp.]
MKVHKIGILIGFACFALHGFAQDVHFSMMRFSPLTVNPGLAGLNGKYNAIVNFKNQWNAVASPYNTIAASFDMKFKEPIKKRGFLAAGINLFYDMAGDLKMTSTNIDANIAYHIRLGNLSTLGLGVQTGFSQRGLGRVDGMYASQYDGQDFNSDIPSGENFRQMSFGFFDVGAGLVYNYNSLSNKIFNSSGFDLKVGFGAYHFTRPNYTYLQGGNDDYNIRYSGFVDAEIPLGKSRIALLPSVYYQRQGKNQEILVGLYIKYKIMRSSIQTDLMDEFSISYAPIYRVNDAFVNAILLTYKEYTLGFAYDVNLSQLTSVSKGRGGVEFIFRYSLKEQHMSSARIH